MNIEITKELFNIIVPSTLGAHSVDSKEHTYRINYLVAGVLVFSFTNYVSAITQYYIQDINT